MNILELDQDIIRLFSILFFVLSISSLAGRMLQKSKLASHDEKLILNLIERINTWWMLIGLFALATVLGKLCSIVLFAVISLLALREFLTISPTSKADHISLLSIFLVVLPCQYMLVAANLYGIFAIFIPVYASIVIPLLSSLGGDNREFLSRVARIQLCIFLCIYFISHAPAILMLNLNGSEGESVKLLCFLAVTVQVSDVAQYIVGKLFGRRPLNAKVSPNKTVEGFIGGITVAGFCGALLSWLTPFSTVEAFSMALLISVLGTGGDLVLSSIKRDSGIKDYSRILPGHGGILDRVDSICFAAPVFFHVTRYFFAA